MLVGPQVEEVRVIEERSFNLSCRVSVPASIDSKVRTGLLLVRKTQKFAS